VKRCEASVEAGEASGEAAGEVSGEASEASGEAGEASGEADYSRCTQPKSGLPGFQSVMVTYRQCSCAM